MSGAGAVGLPGPLSRLGGWGHWGFKVFKVFKDLRGFPFLTSFCLIFPPCEWDW